MATSTSKSTSSKKTAAAKPAAKKPAARGVSAKAAIAQVLADGEARKVKEITAAAAPLATGLKGKTPEQSLAALLYVEAKKDGGLVERGSEKGTFRLRPADGSKAGL